MHTDQNQSESAKLQELAIQRTHQLVHLATMRFGVDIPEPTIRFDLSGQTAGQVRTRKGLSCIVRYNVELLVRNRDDFLAKTVPHESAHLVAYHLFHHRIKPHGREWRSIMRIFGAEPNRCHDYDVGGLQARHLSRYSYRCGCGSHQLTSIRHNRILGGQVYLCRRCGLPLECVPSSDKPSRS